MFICRNNNADFFDVDSADLIQARHTDDDRARYLCPDCGMAHKHSPAPGHRLTHCPRSNDEPIYGADIRIISVAEVPHGQLSESEARALTYSLHETSIRLLGALDLLGNSGLEDHTVYLLLSEAADKIARVYSPSRNNPTYLEQLTHKPGEARHRANISLDQELPNA